MYPSTIILLMAIQFATAEVSNKEPYMRTISIMDSRHKCNDILLSDLEVILCQHIEMVNVDDMKLHSIKSNFIKSDYIKHISLKNNLLTSIPRNILNNVPHLTCLNLAGNRINVYANNLMEHHRLRVLNLTYQETSNSFMSNELEQSEEDDVEDMHKAIIFNSDNMTLSELEYLDLSGNHISSLTMGFNISFPRLTHLFLKDINAVALDPLFFYKIPTSLRVLHLDRNQLRDLTITNMAGVSSLYLGGNPLERLHIAANGLRVLSLANCTLKRADVTLQTPYLEELDLSANGIYHLPDNFFEYLSSLNTLLMNHNRIQQIPLPGPTQQLQKLSLSYNDISYIPPRGFAYASSLRSLSLKGNRIERLEKDTFLGLTMLINLDLSKNKLQNLPYDWTSPLKNLQSLNIKYNQFTTLADMSVGPCVSLRHLFVKNNTFLNIYEKEFTALPNFITLYVY